MCTSTKYSSISNDRHRQQQVPFTVTILRQGGVAGFLLVPALGPFDNKSQDANQLAFTCHYF